MTSRYDDKPGSNPRKVPNPMLKKPEKELPPKGRMIDPPKPPLPRDIGLGNTPRGVPLPPKSSVPSLADQLAAGKKPIGMVGYPMQNAMNSMPPKPTGMKKGGKVKEKSTSSYKSGGSVSSASKRGDGCAQRGKTKGRMV